MAQAPKQISKKVIAETEVKQLAVVRATNVEKQIGVTKEQVQNVIEKEFRDIRRNSSQQIISYTLPKSSTLQYGKEFLPGIKNNLNKKQYTSVINNDIEQFTQEITEFNIDTKKLNSVFFPSADIEAVLQEEPLKFNGELVRIGSGPDAFYYIEDNKFYTFAPGHGYLLNIIAEKSGKPMTFRMNDKFDYSNDAYKYWGTTEIDNGQNQYKLYNDNTYTRASIAYLETNQYGGELTKEKVLGIAAEETLYIKWENLATLDKFSKIIVRGKDCTPIDWDRIKTRPIRECFTSTEEDLTVGVFFDSPLSVTFAFKLFYKNGGNVLLNPSKGTGYTWKDEPFDEYRIPYDKLTDDDGNLVWRIEIDTESRWFPFYQEGTSAGQLRFLEGVITGTQSDGTIASVQNGRAGYGAPLYKWTNAGGGSWQPALSTEQNKVPLYVEGETYKWNGYFFEAYTPALPPTNEIKIDYQMMDGNLIALYGSDGRMNGGDKLVDDLWEAAQDTLTQLNIVRGYQDKKKKQRWSNKIGKRSSGGDETKLLDVLTQTADDINKGGTGYLQGNPFANVNLNFFTNPTSYDCPVSYDDLKDNYELLNNKNSLIQTNPNGGRRDLKQAWEKGDGSGTYGGSKVNSTEKAANKALRIRNASEWEKCIKKRATGREERDLLRLLGHTARAVIRSGNGRIE